ncbi:DNA gyrase inhibitor YacG [Hirschia litorea]|uniref:DNA gyrase inhibitor YacG n=1 Tax=Hirschia litorea TaxID=1199156 RepID=A0ABW2IH11_9PROT
MTLKKCPNCNDKLASNKFDPFCSKRCADVDLNRWMKGSYVIPGPDLYEAEDAPSYRSPQDDER